MKRIFVVSKPRGIPINKNNLNASKLIATSEFDIAKKLPKVNKGPNVRNIVSSPKPFLADSLKGSAV